MSECPICGQEVPADSKFCLRCGSSLTGQTGQLNPNTLLEGRYLVVKTLGRGGMGAVYLALDQRLNNAPVAIKEMSTNAVGAGNLKAAIAAFQKEASMLVSLRHQALPRITDFFDYGEDRWYLVMDYIEGKTLKETVTERGPISEAQVLDWARQLGDILIYLHQQHPPIIFRDLKPSNIMLTPQGQIKLIDFGIARHFRPGMSADTTAYGSSGFAPPEQYGQNQTDSRSDIYAFGATLHYLLTGIDPIKRPFDFELPSKFVEVSPQTEHAIMKAVELKTENRPQTIEELLTLLQGGRLSTTEKALADEAATLDDTNICEDQRFGSIGNGIQDTVKMHSNDLAIHNNINLEVVPNSISATTVMQSDIRNDITETVVLESAGAKKAGKSFSPKNFPNPFINFIKTSKRAPMISAAVVICFVIVGYIFYNSNNSKNTFSDSQAVNGHVTKETLIPGKTENAADSSIADGASSGYEPFKGEWLFYRNYHDGKLYRSKTDGSERSILSDDDAMYVFAEGNWIYYSNVSDRSVLYKIRPDGSNRTKLNDDLTRDICVADGWIYYHNATDKGNLYKISIEGTGRSKMNDMGAQEIVVSGEWIYYRCNIMGSLCRIRTDGSNETRLNEHPSNYIYKTGDWIYYAGDGLEKMRADGSEVTKLCDGEPQYISSSGEWLYFSYTNHPSISSWYGPIYKIRNDGSGLTKLTDDTSDYKSVFGDWIYYANISDGHNLYKIRTDGTDRKKLNDDYAMFINVVSF